MSQIDFEHFEKRLKEITSLNTVEELSEIAKEIKDSKVYKKRSPYSHYIITTYFGGN